MPRATPQTSPISGARTRRLIVCLMGEFLILFFFSFLFFSTSFFTISIYPSSNLEGKRRRLTYPISPRFTTRGKVALAFSALSGILGVAVVIWYGLAPDPNANANAEHRVAAGTASSVSSAADAATTTEPKGIAGSDGNGHGNERRE